VASWELQCISAIMNDPKPSDRFEEAVKIGVRFDTFGTMDGKNLWAAIETHYNRQSNFGHIPSIQWIGELFPSLQLPDPIENFPDLCGKVIDGWVQRQSKKFIDEFLVEVGENPIAAITKLHDRAGEIQEQAKASNDVHYRSVALKESREELREIKAGAGITGMPWPWTKLNVDTGGIQPGDFLMVWALPKSMKCICAGERLMQQDGSMIAIEELPEDCTVPSYTGSSGKIRWASAKRVTSGVKDCVETKTVAGLTLRTSTEHLFMTPDGYARICDLKPGDPVATVMDGIDLVWDLIDSVSPIGEIPCYDVCITDGQDPNFVVEDFIVHNTWFGLIIAAHLFAQGKRILIYSKEMRWPMIRKRINCCIAKIDYEKLKTGHLSGPEEISYMEWVERMVDPGFTGELFFTDADRPDGSPGGPNDIRRKIELYKPHFVMLDSSYMLELPGNGNANALDWKVLSAVSRQLKAICKQTGIPMLAILQENERAALKYTKSRGTASLAMNSGAVMDCDVGLRLVLHKKLQELSIHYAACRETMAHGFTIHALAATNFEVCNHNILHNVGDDSDEAEKEKQKAAAAVLKAEEDAQKKADKMPKAPPPPPPVDVLGQYHSRQRKVDETVEDLK